MSDNQVIRAFTSSGFRDTFLEVNDISDSIHAGKRTLFYDIRKGEYVVLEKKPGDKFPSEINRTHFFDEAMASMLQQSQMSLFENATINLKMESEKNEQPEPARPVGYLDAGGNFVNTATGEVTDYIPVGADIGESPNSSIGAGNSEEPADSDGGEDADDPGEEE